MAALTITGTQVLHVSGLTVTGLAGAAIVQGQSVHFDPSVGQWKLMQADGSTTEAGEHGYGIALSAAGAAGQPIVVALPGSVVTLGAGAAPAAGVVYFAGDAAGSLVPPADMGSTDKATPLALGLTTNRVKILDGAYHAGSIIA